MTDSLVTQTVDALGLSVQAPESSLEQATRIEWQPLTAKEISKTLSRKLPKEMLGFLEKKDRKTGRTTHIPYVPWRNIPRILDKYAPGWSWEIRSVTCTHDRVILVGRLSVITSDCGLVHREGTGTENLKESITDKRTGEVVERDIAYGDPSSNAEAQAFRRAAAKFGLGLYLYDKD